MPVSVALRISIMKVNVYFIQELMAIPERLMSANLLLYLLKEKSIRSLNSNIRSTEILWGSGVQNTFPTNAHLGAIH